jgi:hypothetical protein
MRINEAKDSRKRHKRKQINGKFNTISIADENTTRGCAVKYPAPNPLR